MADFSTLRLAWDQRMLSVLHIIVGLLYMDVVGGAKIPH